MATKPKSRRMATAKLMAARKPRARVVASKPASKPASPPVIHVIRVKLGQLGHVVTHYAVHMLDHHDSRKFVAVNVFRFGCAVGLLYVASHDTWDHVHNFLLGYHVRLIHSHLLGDE